MWCQAVRAEKLIMDRIQSLLGDLHEARELQRRCAGEVLSDGSTVQGHIGHALANYHRVTMEKHAFEEWTARMEDMTPGELAWFRFEELSEKAQAHAWAEVASG
jgi:hypothetical protein